MPLAPIPANRRHHPAALLTGVPARAISGIFTFGWEVPLPPRTAACDATNSPQELPCRHQPFAEHSSQCFGRIGWARVIELTRRDLRNRITHEPDAEVPLPSARAV